MTSRSDSGRALPVRQHTVARSAEWRGERRRRRTDVLVVNPAEADTGIRFLRLGDAPSAAIPARWDAVVDARCGLVLGNGHGAARFDSPANQFQPATTFGKADEICSTPEMSCAGTNGLLLAWSQRDRKLINTWAADHTCNLAGATPILALDMYEHSYHMDFGAAAAKYVDAFMNNLNLAAVSAKLDALKGTEHGTHHQARAPEPG